MRRAKPTVAPDLPQKQIAWTHQVKSVDMAGSSLASGISQEIAGHQVYKAVPVLEASCGSEPSPIRPVESNHNAVVDGGPTTSTPEESARGLPSRTYRSLKEMVTRGFSNQKSAPDTSLSPQSQLRQAGIYLQPQPAQFRTPQTHQQQQQQQQQQQTQQQTITSSDSYRVYPVGSYVETPRRDLSKAQSHDSLLSSQDNRYRQEGPNIGGGSQAIYMQQQDQRVLYGAAGPSRLQYLYSGQQTADNRFNYPEPSRHIQYSGPRNYNYSPEQLASQRRHFVQQQRHNELQQQRLLGERMGGEGQQLRPVDGGGGQYDHSRHQQDQQLHIHPQQIQRQQQHLELPNSHFSEQQRHHDQLQGAHLGETRQVSESYTDNQRQINEQQSTQQNEPRSHDNKPISDLVTQDNAINSDEAGKSNKLDIPKPSSPEDDDEGGFVKRGAQSDSGRGSTVYSSVKANPSTVTGEKNGEEWSERVETELRQILSGSGASSESLSSVSPPLPPLSPPASSGEERPKFSLNTNSLGLGNGFKTQSGPLWVSRGAEKNSRSHHKPSKSTSNLLSSRLEIDSMLDENNSSDEELDYADTRLIRKQLEGLESMYGQVLKLLKARRQHGYDGLESSLRHSRRRTCGSVSSVPSSVSSRPIRTSRNQPRGKVRDFKGINKRFQRLESHVVTLARSVAHLSSEMRTQHLMMQEMEVMRGELAALRIQSNAQQQQHQQSPMVLNPGRVGQGNSTTPDKVKRLTKFFGDEPPLLRLFLRGLGYEKYANLFEKERIGLLELPYLTEDRLHKLGIPLGPRLRILQQAHLANPNTLAVL